MNICGDNRFEIIARVKKALLEGTNIDMSNASKAGVGVGRMKGVNDE